MSKPKATATATERRDIYSEVTDTIVAALEQGTIPWHRPWSAAEQSLPVSVSTGKLYRGINPFLLQLAGQTKGYASPWWGTFKALQERGGSVRKGEKGTLVVFWKRLVVATTPEERAATGKDKKAIPMLRHYNVFNAEQADGMPEKYAAQKIDHGPDFDPITAAEVIADGYKGGPVVYQHEGGARAFYRPSTDAVHMPARWQFDGAEEYYSTLFHELTHSTGHSSRLNRPTLLESHSFGDANYSREELVAEMGAAMLAGVAGIHQTTVPNSAAYVAGWLKALRGDKKLVVSAGGQAQRAADHILGVTYSEDEEN